MTAEPSLSALFSKQGLVTVQLARDLLKYKPGDQIARAQDYSREFQVGTGTVQAAFQQLHESGVVKFNARGRLGTFIEEIDYPGLWQFTMHGSLVGSMPLPYSRLYEGLATGLYEVFRQAGVPLNLTYVRGSLNRVEALLHGRSDFIVMSRLAYNKLLAEGKEIALSRSLGPGTWIDDHVIVLRDSKFSSIQSRMRVGVDTQSIDHVLLVERACAGKNVELVEIGYMQVRSALSVGHIDATVWNIDDFAVHPEPSFKTLSAIDSGFSDLRDIYSEAVILIKKGDKGIENLLDAILDNEKIVKIQKQVVVGERLPLY